MSKPISVLIVDDHAIVREGLRTLLSEEDDILVLGEAATGLEALELAQEKRPDVILMDLILPEMDGIEVTRHLQKRDSDSRVIILTSTFGEDMRVAEAIQAGAVGFLLKDVLRPELLSAIHRAAEGKPTLHLEAQEQLMRQTAAPKAPHHDLTARELDVLVLIATGKSNKRIATALNLSEGTVKGYVSIILSKLGVADRTQAALYAVKHKLGKYDD